MHYYMSIHIIKTITNTKKYDVGAGRERREKVSTNEGPSSPCWHRIESHVLEGSLRRAVGASARLIAKPRTLVPSSTQSRHGNDDAALMKSVCQKGVRAQRERRSIEMRQARRL